MPRLPPETLDQIVAHIDQESHLLNLASSSKEWYSVVVPSHLHYRDIRTQLNHTTLWAALSSVDDLKAQNVRSLTIVPNYSSSAILDDTYSRSTRLPVDVDDPEFEYEPSIGNDGPWRTHEIEMIKALKRMTSLRSFKWHRGPCPTAMIEGTESIWGTLLNLDTIRELDIFYATHGFPLTRALAQQDDERATPFVLAEDFLRLLPQLTSLSARMMSSIPSDGARLLETAIHSALNLEELVLYLDGNGIWAAINFHILLTDPTFAPRLRVLRTRGWQCPSEELKQFLVSHPALEELCLSPMMLGHSWNQFDLPSDALPNLRHLVCHSSQAVALLSPARPITHLGGVEAHENVQYGDYWIWDQDWDDDGPPEVDEEDYWERERPSPWKSAFLTRLRAQTSIESLAIASYASAEEIRHFAEAVPQIKALSTEFGHCERVIEEEEWYGLYALFPKLQIIEGCDLPLEPHAMGPDLTSKSIDAIRSLFARVLSACPELQTITPNGSWSTGDVIHIVKGSEEDSVRWVVRSPEERFNPHAKEGELVFGW